MGLFYKLKEIVIYREGYLLTKCLILERIVKNIYSEKIDFVLRWRLQILLEGGFL